MKVKEMERSTGVAWILNPHHVPPVVTKGWVLLQRVGFAAFEGVCFLLHPFGGKVVATGESSSDIENNLT